jgi:hypothetical protein
LYSPPHWHCRHIFVCGLQLVPLFVMLEERKSRGRLEVVALVWACVVVYFSLATVTFYHETHEVIPVRVVPKPVGVAAGIGAPCCQCVRQVCACVSVRVCASCSTPPPCPRDACACGF